MAALEEEKASGANISDDDINSVKIGLMGLAGIGDSWFQVGFLLWSLGASMAIEGNILGPIIWVVFFYLQMVGLAGMCSRWDIHKGRTLLPTF